MALRAWDHAWGEKENLLRRKSGYNLQLGESSARMSDIGLSMANPWAISGEIPPCIPPALVGAFLSFFFSDNNPIVS